MVTPLLRAILEELRAAPWDGSVGLKRGGLLLSLLVLPLYVPTLIFGAEVARRGAEGLETQVPLMLLGAITLGVLAAMPFAAAAALRINLR